MSAWVESDLAAHIRRVYGLSVASFHPLEGGADFDASVFRVDALAGPPYFLKIRRTPLGLASVAIPSFLHAQGIRQVLAPLATRQGELFSPFQDAYLILYPFHVGQNAMQTGLNPHQWVELGRVMRAVHASRPPAELLCQIPAEDFSPIYRKQTAAFLQRALAGEFERGLCPGLAQTLCAYQNEIENMLRRATELAGALLQRRDRWFVICHADLHKWNIQVGADGGILILDWDSLKFAPKECDLMYIGGNIGGFQGDNSEQPAFYAGYGAVQVDSLMLAYYRYERIITDIALFCRQAWEEAGQDEEGCVQIIGYVSGDFKPGCEYEAALRADQQITAN